MCLDKLLFCTNLDAQLLQLYISVSLLCLLFMWALKFFSYGKVALQSVHSKFCLISSHPYFSVCWSISWTWDIWALIFFACLKVFSHFGQLTQRFPICTLFWWARRLWCEENVLWHWSHVTLDLVCEWQILSWYFFACCELNLFSQKSQSFWGHKWTVFGRCYFRG